MAIGDIFYIFSWWLALLLIGVGFYPLTSRIFRKFIDKGYLFSKIIGLLFISYATFILSSLHLLKFNTFNIYAIGITLIALNFILIKIKGLKKPDFKLIVLEELIFLVALVVWAYVKSFQPDIRDLEKFMDFGFLNSILRTDYFPAKDMWLSPFSINYYYFGHLFTAVLTKITNVPSFISFNLMLSLLFAFTFSMSFSIGINFIEGLKKFSFKKITILGIFFSLVVSLSGNLQTIYAFFKSYSGDMHVPFWQLPLSLSGFPNSYWYPTATRFIYRTIHEFPLYSFVVADLHGHVLDIPIVLLIIALLLHFFKAKEISIPLVFFSSFLLAIAYMTNAWDGLIYLGLFMLIYLLFSLREAQYKFAPTSIGFIKRLAVLGFGFFVFTLVFNLSFSPFANGIGLNCAPSQLLKVGHIGPFLFESGQCEHTPFWQFFILYGSFIFFSISFLLFLRKKITLEEDKLAVIFIVFSYLLIILPEFFYLKDIYSGYFRANTMFKLSYQAFILLSFTSAYAFLRIIFSIGQFRKSYLKKLLFGFFVAGSIIVLFFVSIYPYFAIPSGYSGLSKYKGLNGINYIKENNEPDFLAIMWLNRNISGQPVILEAQGDSYTDFARISSNTGIPTVLGWTVHEWLWRNSYEVPSARFDDIRNLYEAQDLNNTKKIAKKYNVSYIYIGEKEKKKYKVNEEKFFKLGDLVYSNQEVKIFKLRDL